MTQPPCAGGCGKAVRHPRQGDPPSMCADCHIRRRQQRRRRRWLERKLARSAAGSSSSRIWCQGACGECGEQFLRVGPTTHCSLQCAVKERRARRRALTRGMKVAPVRRFRIYDRDNWTCHICHLPVDPAEVVPAPAAPVLDHVVALAAGGEHSEANLRTAHFYCNSVKRDLPLELVSA